MKNLVIAVLLLSGCSTVQTVYTKNGEQAQRIACPGVGMNYCYEKALEICPSGYLLVEDLSRPASSGINVQVGNNVGEAAILVKCKA